MYPTSLILRNACCQIEYLHCANLFTLNQNVRRVLSVSYPVIRNVRKHFSSSSSSFVSPSSESNGSSSPMRTFESRYGAKVNWFPGHMATATRNLTDLCESADVIIEVRDARVPFSSANPILDTMVKLVNRGNHPSFSGTHEAISSSFASSSPSSSSVLSPHEQQSRIPPNSSRNNNNSGSSSSSKDVTGTRFVTSLIAAKKPRIIVFNKADLANDQLQSRILKVVEQQGYVGLFTSAEKGTHIHRMLKLVDQVRERSDKFHFRTTGTIMVIVGIPNVGKSTLINAVRHATGIKEGKGAAVAPTPGYTRHISAIKVRKTPPLYLCDSPGIMPPRITDIETGLKLAVSTAVKESSVPPLVQAEYLLYMFETLNTDRYVQPSGLNRTYTEEEVEIAMGEIALKQGMRKLGGKLDLDSAAIHFVRLFQQGLLGRYTLDYIPSV